MPERYDTIYEATAREVVARVRADNERLRALLVQIEGALSDNPATAPSPQALAKMIREALAADRHAA